MILADIAIVSSSMFSCLGVWGLLGETRAAARPGERGWQKGVKGVVKEWLDIVLYECII